jgi:hypothetical protein
MMFVYTPADDTLAFYETPDFIAPDLWPPNSPDLNPVDHKIRGIMQEHVYQMPIRDISEPRQRLIDTWSGIQQSIIVEAVEEWRNRLKEEKKLCSSQRRTI